MPHARQSCPPRARPVWQKARHPFPKHLVRPSTLADTIKRYTPKG